MAIPFAVGGRDICAAAKTVTFGLAQLILQGSGKTAAFVVPILERLLLRTRRVAAIRAL
jgi:superfamily II DNA/RNA helicase